MQKLIVVFGIVALFVFFLLQAGTNAQAPSGTNAVVPRYDLLLKGGHLIDPASGLDAKMDVAVSLGRIANVRPKARCHQDPKAAQ